MSERQIRTPRTGDGPVVQSARSTSPHDNARWVLKGLLAVCLVLSSVMWLSGNHALAWFGLTDVVASSHLCPPLPGDPRPVQYDHRLHNTRSLWTAAAWVLLLAAALMARRSTDAASRALQLSLLVSAVGLALYGGSWLESVLLGQPYTELVGCSPSPAEMQARTDHFNQFRAILAFSAGCLMLPSLRPARAQQTPSTQVHRVAPWRWTISCLAVLIALLLVLPLLLGLPHMPPDQAFVVKELTALPLGILGLISLAALSPSRRLRPAAADAVKAAAALAFSNLTAVWVLRHTHEKWSVGPAAKDFTVGSDLSPKALDSLAAAEFYHFYVLFAICVIWGASWLVGRLLLPGQPGRDADHLGAAPS